MDFLFSNIDAVTMCGEGSVLRNAFIGVDKGQVSYIGANPPESSARRVIDGRGKVLIPGLINAHCHAAMTLFRGLADDFELETWLREHILPAEDKLNARAVAVGTALGIAEMLASGTTSFSDMYFMLEDAAEEILSSGIKANLSIGLTMQNPDDDPSKLPRAAEADSLRRAFHMAENGMIRTDSAIHAEYTSSPRLWSYVADYAAKHSLRIQAHVSETRDEHKKCMEKYGKTPVAVFEEYGLLNTGLTAAHCTWVSDADMEILKTHRAHVAHNPVSNLKLASGIARIPEMISQEVSVALGTDGAASNNSLDMFEEIKAAVTLHKARLLSPTVLNAYEALKLATTGGAAAQGRENECGKIKKGFDADLVLLDFDKPHLQPCNNIVSNVVYSARGGDVYMTMVRGKILYENGEFLTMDIRRIKNALKNDPSVTRILTRV